MAAGTFREDLFYRINVVVLRLPPLRERSGDVLLLAAHFLEHFNAKFAKKVGPLSPAALQALEAQGWPGNVRQLKHAIERLVALHPGGPVAETLAYQEARQDFERDYLRRLLASAGGNVSEAARLSGIPRQNLYVRMKRWGLVIE